MLQTLPAEIVEHILLLSMSPQSSCRTAQTCRYLRTIITGMHAWEYFYRDQWRQAIPLVEEIEKDVGSASDTTDRSRGERWHQLFKWRFLLERNIDASLHNMSAACVGIDTLEKAHVAEILQNIDEYKDHTQARYDTFGCQEESGLTAVQREANLFLTPMTPDNNAALAYLLKIPQSSVEGTDMARVYYATQVSQLLVRLHQQGRIASYAARCNDVPLEYGALLLEEVANASYVRPQLGVLDALAEKVRGRTAAGASRVERLRVLVTVLGEDFRGNDEDYYNAENSYFSRVLVNKKGNPITLASVCASVGRRVGLTLAGVNFPRHFYLCLQTDDESTYVYVDCFRFTIHSAAELHQRLPNMSDRVGAAEMATLTRRFFTPVGPAEVFQRMCRNLVAIHQGFNMEFSVRYSHGNPVSPWSSSERETLQHEHLGATQCDTAGIIPSPRCLDARSWVVLTVVLGVGCRGRYSGILSSISHRRIRTLDAHQFQRLPHPSVEGQTARI
eukprot:m.511185 g.511185  ORF g.511185 m.511185 type:complete len:503 (+) comp21892_c1_seq4:250-1758(+)